MKYNKALIIGGDSVIGQSIAHYFKSTPIECITTTRRRSNCTDTQLFFDLETLKGLDTIQGHYDCIIIAAGITRMSDCLNRPEQSHLINVTHTLKTAESFQKTCPSIIFLSSNLALHHGPISSNTHSNGHYSTQKKLVETALLDSVPQACIIRLSKVIHPNFSLFHDWLNALKNRRSIHPFLKKNISPISIDFVTKCIVKIISSKAPVGCFNISAKEDTTYQNIAHHIAKGINAPQTLVQPVMSPSHSSINVLESMNCDSLINTTGLVPPSPFEAIDSYLAHHI